MRVVLAVITGYIVFAVSATLLYQLTGHNPMAAPSLGFEIASVIWGMLFAGLGGYIAARGARHAGLTASILVGCLIAAGSLVALLLGASATEQLASMLLMAPAACAGGLFMRRKPS